MCLTHNPGREPLHRAHANPCCSQLRSRKHLRHEDISPTLAHSDTAGEQPRCSQQRDT